MDVFAVLLVITAGAMWAGCGLAAQDFFSRSSLTPMDLTVFRMFCAGVIMMALTIAKAFLLWDHRADADALDILCIDRSRECSGRNRDTIYLSCHRDPMDILQEGKASWYGRSRFCHSCHRRGFPSGYRRES